MPRTRSATPSSRRGRSPSCRCSPLGFNPTFNFSDSSTQKTESGQALITFQKGQPSGAADPTTVLLRSTDGQPLDDAELKAYAAELGTAEGVASAALTARTD